MYTPDATQSIYYFLSQYTLYFQESILINKFNLEYIIYNTIAHSLTH